MAKVSKRTAALFVLASVVLTSVAQLLFKLGMMNTTFFGESPTSVTSIIALLAAANQAALAGGVVLYAISMLFWIFALTRFPVSLAYPMLSLSYMIVYLVATLRPEFGEAGSTVKLAGVVILVVGISVLATGKHD